MNTYKKISLTLISILNYQLTIFCASNYEMVSQKSEHGISLKAEDFPILLEGFKLCGRYDLQEFFDQKLQVLNPIIQNDQPDNIDESINIFTTIDSITELAQAEIVTILSNDKISATKFYTMLKNMTFFNIDLKQPSNLSYFCCINHHKYDFFRYCISTEFMRPVVFTYLKDGDNICLQDKILELWRFAIILNRPQIIQLYIDTDNRYKDALMRVEHLNSAIIYNADKVIPILSANINAQDNVGNTPLHNLVKDLNTNISSRGKKIIPVLIAAGADLGKQNNEGKRPWDLAESEKIRDLLQPIAAENNKSYCTIS